MSQFDFCPIQIFHTLVFYKILDLSTNYFWLNESFVTVLVLLLFVLSPFKFVAIFILLQFEFCPIYSLSHRKFCTNCKYGTFRGFFLNLDLVTILVVSTNKKILTKKNISMVFRVSEKKKKPFFFSFSISCNLCLSQLGL